MKKKDYLEIIRYTFVGVFLVSIVRKVFLPEFEINFRNFFISLTSMLDYQSKIIWSGLIIFEIFIVIGIFYYPIFKHSFYSGLILLSAGIILSGFSLVLGIQASCGCGLFGDNPYLILLQKLALITILIILNKNKMFLFSRRIKS